MANLELITMEPNNEQREHDEMRSKHRLAGILAGGTAVAAVTTIEIMQDNLQEAAIVAGAGTIVVAGLAWALDRWNQRHLPREDSTE